MKFYVLGNKDAIPADLKYPCFILRHDTWDDYGFKTLFELSIYIRKDERQKIGPVKILNEDQESSYTPLPSDNFTSLTKKYCSLGQNIEYYNALKKLSSTCRNKILRGLKDAATNSTIKLKFESHPGFNASLLRISSAEQALKEARAIIETTTPRILSNEDYSFVYEFFMPNKVSAINLKFDFSPQRHIAYRLNVLIGKNASGKTQILSDMALRLSGIRRPKVATQPFGKIIAVSFSAFDSFTLPEELEGSKRTKKTFGSKSSLFNYVYCGIRKTPPNKKSLAFSYELMSQKELTYNFRNAYRKVCEKHAQVDWPSMIAPVLNEASFAEYDLESIYDSFKTLSSGQKVVMLSLLQILYTIDRQSMLLLDEPENHLHPALTAAYIHSILNILESFDSYAIVATHSPLILQETPSKYVQILDNYFGTVSVKIPKIETYGNSFGEINEEVFEISTDTTDYHAHLAKLAKKGCPLDEIESNLGRGLNIIAKTYYLNIYRRYYDDKGNE